MCRGTDLALPADDQNGNPFERVLQPLRRLPRRVRRDDAVADVIGNVMIVGLTVLMTAGLVTLLLATKPGPVDEVRAEFGVQVKQGDEGWGSGDEYVRVTHQGGEALSLGSTVIVIGDGSTSETFREDGTNKLEHPAQNAFDSGADDTRFSIGEIWRTPDRTIELADQILLNIVDTHETNKVVWSTSARAGSVSCTTDLQAPSVTAWVQVPSDVTAETTGTVDVTATIEDICNDVDASNAPHLEYRINTGSNPSWNDTGAMTNPSGDQWEGQVPDITYAPEYGKTLEYRVTGMTDTEGNTGNSGIRQDVIDLVGANAYVQTPLGMVTGSSANDDDARSANDNEAAAKLTEASGTAPQADEYYGSSNTAHAGTLNPANAEAAPDDSYAELDANGEYVEVSTFGSGTGAISKVEIALEGRWTGSVDKQTTDTVSLSHTAGGTSQAYELQGDTDTQHFLDITSDEADGWTWTEIQNLGVRATCQCHDNPNDDKTFHIDSLWVRVTHDATVYDLETDTWTFDPLGGGSTHVLELRYRLDGPETFELQIHDGTTWVAQDDKLTSSTYEVWTKSLTSAEVSAGPEVRILDLETSQNTETSIDIDYLRVVSP